MSFTDTAKHWHCGCEPATAASRSDVNVAMPHLRGKWSPTKAILRTLECSCMRCLHGRGKRQHQRGVGLSLTWMRKSPMRHFEENGGRDAFLRSDIMKHHPLEKARIS